VNLPVGVDSEGKLIASAVVREKEQVIKWHIKLPEIRIGPEGQIFGFDLRDWPNHIGAMIGLHAVSFFHELSKLTWYDDSKLNLGSGQAPLVGTYTELCIGGETRDLIFE